MRVILSFLSFLHTIIGISVPVLWHMFNMKNRFYITPIPLFLYLFRNCSHLNMYRVFLAGNAVPVTSYWWGITYVFNGFHLILSHSFHFLIYSSDTVVWIPVFKSFFVSCFLMYSYYHSFPNMSSIFSKIFGDFYAYSVYKVYIHDIVQTK